MDAQFFTDIGTTRSRNEDSGGVFTNYTGQQLLLICDGMGGHNAGDFASQYVTEQMKQRFINENYIEQNTAEQWLKTQIHDINTLLYKEAQLQHDKQGMGTTLVAAIVYDHHVIIANVGDSRCYLINNREMRQLTNDHTFVNHLVMMGELSHEEAAVHPRRNIVTKVIGTDRHVTPDIYSYKTSTYETLLLNSDGLTDYVDHRLIHQILTKHQSINESGNELIEVALQSQVKDNISFILCNVGGDSIAWSNN